MTCTGWSGCSGDQSYVYAEYHCEWAGDGDPPAGVETTLETTKGLTVTTPVNIHPQTSPLTTEVLSTEATTPAVPTTNAQRTTGSTTPEITTTFTTAQRPSTQPTMTSESTSESVNQSQPSMQDTTTITSPTTNGTQSPVVPNVTQKPLEEILTACFDNATEGESSAKPYRPLSFSTPSDTETDRLTVSFYSPFLQTKPVKVAIEAFQEPKPGCDTSPASSTSTTPSSPDDKASGSSLSLNSVVNVTVYCYNGAPLRLREGEYVDVVFPAKIDFENEVPVCTSMKQDEHGWEWTSEGCKAVYSNYTHVTCRCDHLSAIALQRGPKGFKVDGINAFLLSILEKILGFISIISIFVMLVVYATLGVKGSQLTKIQLNIAVSSLAGHVLFLFGMKATGNLFVCAIIAACLQYLYTVYALWLVVQTAVLFNTCYLHGKPRDSNIAQPVQVKVPEKGITEPIRLTRIFLLVWGGSLLLVGLLYKEIPYGFGTPESCWLVETVHVYIIFISLITVALVINFVLAILTVVYLIKIDDKPTEHIDGYAEWTEKLRNRVSLCLSSSLVLSFVLVMAWSSHALLVFKSIIAFDYLFIMFNMIQGFLIFVFYCPVNPEVRAAIFGTKSSDEEEKKESDDERKN
ncbi:adhesion G protein-coupled receptor E1-like [Lytechinus variegatus]|uniref:adhesion G protein-coupled receptor E1-like n=1 Tax=Lytechinus variegatus TaxID=7654 RepID=UPI001BB25E48|nr:adhesion G protein-coupled receptor E1-like [Lytechinus variegatus]